MPEAKSLDVERARVAYREVSQLTCPNDQSAESKRSARLRELPSMLYNHGLGQTFAFCVAKGKKLPFDPKYLDEDSSGLKAVVKAEPNALEPFRLR